MCTDTNQPQFGKIGVHALYMVKTGSTAPLVENEPCQNMAGNKVWGSVAPYGAQAPATTNASTSHPNAYMARATARVRLSHEQLMA